MTRLTVAIRVRPLSERELAAKSVSIVSVEDGKTVAVTNIKVPEQNAGDSRERIRRFSFDYCFNYKSTQEDVYAQIGKEIAKAIQKRFHSCILTYGQSASGKTHTMIGSDGDEGIVARLCQSLFNYLAEAAVGSELQNVHAAVSYLEIYNEKVRDLLDPKAKNVAGSTLKVREHPKTGPYVQGLSERIVTDSNALLSLLHAGNANRTIGATNANPRSSRSHSVFTITCLGGLKLRFVDLAGSERAGSHTTSRFREGSNINKSLVALRNVISALAEWSKLPKSKNRFVPYRDSVLTWLLKGTLGGNSKTILISTVSPSSTCYSETVNTLRFGQRARQIVVQPLFNEDPKERTIRELRAEIAKLRDLLEHVHKPLSPSTTTIVTCKDHQTPELYARNNCDSDSGVSENPPSNASDDDEDHLRPSLIDAVQPEKIVVVEELIPVMNVTTEMAKADTTKRPLQRTFSMDQSRKPPGSQEGSINDKKVPGLRKTSIGKSNTSLKSLRVKKPTESKPKIEPKPKVDTHRKVQPKPRSQIVAAVTQRLYNKVKKKEVATDTLDLANPIRDLSITSQARFRLQELTKQALKAHRRKNAETQTSLFPVLRLKEVGTDVTDLKLLNEEVAHVDTATDTIDYKDASTNCTFIETLQNANEECIERPKSAILITRSCGTSMDYEIKSTEEVNMESRSSMVNHGAPLSFTKYLMPQMQAPTFEIVNPATANPIYTSSVNINVNHNYSNPVNPPPPPPNDGLSDDSLEESQCQSGTVCFPTPDLISNHNSLEPHAQLQQQQQQQEHEEPSHAQPNGMRFATNNTLEDTPIDDTLNLLPSSNNVCIANCSLEDSHSRATANMETQYAPQMCLQDDFDDDYDLFYKAPPQKFRSNVTHDHLHVPVHEEEPIILKSIMKCNDALSEDEESLHMFENIPDSLNYYYEKERKKVHFDSSPSPSPLHRQDDRMLDAMTNFMKEVTTLMSNLTRVASRFDANDLEQTYDMHVVVNDIQGFPEVHPSSNRCKHESLMHLSESTQTLPISTSDTGTEIEFDDFPINKYEALVESSCERLENVIRRSNDRRSDVRYQGSFSIASDWNCRNLPEDSSLESQPTFSDYGSLPRRRQRLSSFSSPSNYLRQLTNMRREIVRSSRDELLNEAHMHL